MIHQFLRTYSEQLKQQGLHRQRIVAKPINSQSRLHFSSNDYLSLTTDKRVKRAFQRGFALYPSGSGGSMVICGYHPIHRQLEQAFSRALNADDALLYSSGYAANLSVIALLARLQGHLLIDKASHASFYDGLTQTRANYTRFLHNNSTNLATKLKQAKSNPVVITESVFSMTGQIACLNELAPLCAQHAAALIVDEAHAFGVRGPEGLGAIVDYGLSQQAIPLRIIPLGKAFAAQGAVVVGQGDWIDALLQCSRAYIYSTALSPAMAYGVLETFSIIREADDRREKLQQLIAYFQHLAKHSPLKWRFSQTAIQQLQLACPHRALACAQFLQNKDIFCQAMRAPTVSKKDTGLRVILNYQHEARDLDYLFSQLQQFHDHLS